MAADVAVGAHQHTDVAKEAADAPDGEWTVIIEAIATLFPNDDRRWQVCPQLVGDADGSSSRAAAAVRATEGLVRVVVHHVCAEIARPSDAEDGVHVRAVEINQSTPLVNQPGNLRDLLIEESQR